MAWVTPVNRATGDIITAAIWNQDIVSNLIALDATFDRLLAQIAIASTSSGIAGTDVVQTVTVTVNNISDKIIANAGIQISTATIPVHIRDNTDGIDGPVMTAGISTSNTPLAAVFTAPTVGSHSIQLRKNGGTHVSSWLIAQVIPNNV